MPGGDVTHESGGFFAGAESLNRAYDMFMLECDQSVGHREALWTNGAITSSRSALKCGSLLNVLLFPSCCFVIIGKYETDGNTGCEMIMFARWEQEEICTQCPLIHSVCVQQEACGCHYVMQTNTVAPKDHRGFMWTELHSLSTVSLSLWLHTKHPALLHTRY